MPQKHGPVLAKTRIVGDRLVFFRRESSHEPFTRFDSASLPHPTPSPRDFASLKFADTYWFNEICGYTRRGSNPLVGTQE